MKLAASYAIAELASDSLSSEHVLPEPFDKRVADAVATAVMEHIEK